VFQCFSNFSEGEEGIKNLEFALPQLKSAKATYRALVEAYRHPGMTDVAAEHTRIAQ